MAQVVVDNPGQVAAVAAATIVLTRAAVNAVRPRTAVEGLALMLVLQLAVPKLAQLAVERGYLRFRVRDADGKLVPMVPGKVIDEGDTPAPA